jgi:Ran GTPase-activating protein (RanGAP) involved in mRNA processing and transport
VRIWDGDIGDEGCRAFQQFITDKRNSSVTILELLNCGIGPLGCEFISRMFEPSLPAKIGVLTLDYNNFGNAGLYNLMNYFKNNKTLTYLSLAYCGIDENGVKYLDEFIKTTDRLETLILQGNPLKNAGVNELINSSLNLNETIEELNLNNVLFGNDPDAVNSLATLITTNPTLIIYHLKFNFLSYDGM